LRKNGRLHLKNGKTLLFHDVTKIPGLTLYLLRAGNGMVEMLREVVKKSGNKQIMIK
jgi:hypothetical protein